MHFLVCVFETTWCCQAYWEGFPQLLGRAEYPRVCVFSPPGATWLSKAIVGGHRAVSASPRSFCCPLAPPSFPTLFGDASWLCRLSHACVLLMGSLSGTPQLSGDMVCQHTIMVVHRFVDHVYEPKMALKMGHPLLGCVDGFAESRYRLCALRCLTAVGAHTLHEWWMDGIDG